MRQELEVLDYAVDIFKAVNAEHENSNEFNFVIVY